MQVDLAGARSIVESMRTAFTPIVEQLDEARHIEAYVLDSLRPQQGGRVLSEGFREFSARQLDDAITLTAAARNGAREAFDAGHWVTRSIDEHGTYLARTRELLQDPLQAIGAADQTTALMQANRGAVDDAMTAMRELDVDSLLDDAMVDLVEPATDRAFARIAGRYADDAVTAPSGLRLEDATRAEQAALDLLEPHLGQYWLPEDVALTAAAHLDEAATAQRAAADRVREIFGHGSWMDDAASSQAMHAEEAARQLRNPDARGVAGYATELLQTDRAPRDAATISLVDGDAARLLDTSTSAQVHGFDPGELPLIAARHGAI